LLIAAVLTLSLLAGCRKEPVDDGPAKDGQPAPREDPKKDGDPVKDGDPKKDGEPARKPDVPFVPTPDEAVEKMLEVANLTDKDVVYDLGCGDGRIVLAAARKYKCKAVGYDIDPKCLAKCEAAKARESKEVRELVSFEKADILTVDLTPASVIMVYLSDELLEKLTPAFKKMRPGSRIVSHNRLIPGADKDAGFPLEVPKKNGFVTLIYRYTTPLKVDD
jgi:SAM-dependent methyltransferase